MVTFLPTKNRSYLSKWRAWQVLVKAMVPKYNYEKTHVKNITQIVAWLLHSSQVTAYLFIPVYSICVSIFNLHQYWSLSWEINSWRSTHKNQRNACKWPSYKVSCRSFPAWARSDQGVCWAPIHMNFDWNVKY